MFVKVEKTSNRVAKNCGFKSLSDMISELKEPSIIDWYLVDYDETYKDDLAADKTIRKDITIYNFMAESQLTHGYRVYTEKCTGWVSPDGTIGYVTEECADKVM